ncbi:hypothetical protein HPP92_007846 [Vanilla planifolia]|uniref:Uncharacterized protein n=1 Tax=Vanilla planifolia TaxID=51239 RepID=A0A835V6F6_VANPL|nr:hypothetical protein HPP92_008015 [Vanilla planifolia]KAG0490983.1 hypothetical protein HPP92_007846 [Vanilla planifolia]
MGLPSSSVALLRDGGNKENDPLSLLRFRASIGANRKKKRSKQRRQRRIPLQDITHLCNCGIAQPIIFPFSSSSYSSPLDSEANHVIPVPCSTQKVDVQRKAKASFLRKEFR